MFGRIFISPFLTTLLFLNSAFSYGTGPSAFRAPTSEVRCQEIFEKAIETPQRSQILEAQILYQQETLEEALKFLRTRETRPAFLNWLFRQNGQALYKLVQNSLYKKYLIRGLRNSDKNWGLSILSSLNPALRHQARIISAMESVLFFEGLGATPQRSPFHSVSTEELNKLTRLYQEFIKGFRNPWNTFTRRSWEVFVTSLTGYIFYFPAPLSPVDLLDGKLSSPGNKRWSWDLTSLKMKFATEGPTPENLKLLRKKLGPSPKIEMALNFAIRALKIFTISAALYYLLVDGGLHDVSFFLTPAQQFETPAYSSFQPPKDLENALPPVEPIEGLSPTVENHPEQEPPTNLDRVLSEAFPASSP